MKRNYFLLTLALVSLSLNLVTGCHATPPNPLQSPSSSQQSQVSPLSSPLLASPAQLKGPNFEIIPLKDGEVSLAGHGPYDLPFEIIDVTFSGRLLAAGTIDHEGNFKVPLRQPAIVGHILGIQIVDLTGTSFKATDEFVAELDAKAGPGFKYYPELGAVFASVVVSP